MQYEVIVVGGSYAGLAAATQLARARRRVLVVDAGQRRNRFAEHSHGFLTQDGTSAAAIIAEGRRQLLLYETRLDGSMAMLSRPNGSTVASGCGRLTTRCWKRAGWCWPPASWMGCRIYPGLRSAGGDKSFIALLPWIRTEQRTDRCAGDIALGDASGDDAPGLGSDYVVSQRRIRTGLGSACPVGRPRRPARTPASESAGRRTRP
jgi:hypothetical protein